MFPEFFQQRLKDLEDNLKQELIRLKDYEDGLRDKTGSELKVRYRQYIEERRYYIAQYQHEYQELQQYLNSSSSLQTPNVTSQFQQIDEKLNILIINQGAIADGLEKTRQDLLNRYDSSEQVMVGEIAQQLDRFQLALTQKLLYAMEANLVSEQQMQEMLAVVEKRTPCLPASQAEKVAKVIKDPEIDSTHKLKVSLPIVPLLVEYEGTIELGSGLNLKTVWEQLIAKLRRKPKRITPLGNYTKLREFLEKGQWREADLETSRVMLEVAGRQEQGWLRTQDIEKFPVADLRIIDNLWFNLSQNRFGFRVQREIWLSISPQLGEGFDGNLFPKFGENLGWRKNNQWLKYDRFCFTLEAPEGHLPSFPLAHVKHKDSLSFKKSNFQDLLSRIATC